MTRSPGVKRAASRCQLPSTDTGHTTSVGPSTGSARTVASSCAVLPNPMSSARQAPRPSRPRNDSQATPRSWYGRSWPSKPAGVATAADPGVERAVEQVPQPACGVYAGDRRPFRRAQVVEPHPGPHQVGDAGPPPLTDEAERGLQLVGTDLDPSSPHLHEVLLGRGRRL